MHLSVKVNSKMLSDTNEILQIKVWISFFAGARVVRTQKQETMRGLLGKGITECQNYVLEEKFMCL